MPFIHDDFLLSTKAAQRLYHDFASGEPILDYHSHLSPADIADDRGFANLFEIWLEGDHYKWRAMRAAGVDENLCTGDATPKQKFLAWARTVPQTLRNPLYHWTHLELKRHFEIDALLGPATAEAIWEEANDQLASRALSTNGILKRFDVRVVCTTDDPAESLGTHRRIAASGLSTRVYPTFRPDKALAIGSPAPWNAWVDRLAAASDVEIGSLANLLDALDRRHQAFHDLGCRLSDHGLPYCYSADCPTGRAEKIFAAARRGVLPSADDQASFAAHLMHFFGALDANRGWTKQLHLGALRNNRTRLFEAIGADVGCDAMGDWPQAESLVRYLDRLDQHESLPQTILYNNHPADNYAFATIVGSFQDGRTAGKLQLGSAWWHLDQQEGMEAQINTVSAVGLLPRFIGMLTDSRSFLSFPRHEYFRRVLCNLVGEDVESGSLPNDFELAGAMVRDVCFANAKEYLGLACGSSRPSDA